MKVGSSAAVTLSVAPSARGIFAAVSNGDGTLTTGCGPLTQDPLPECQLPVSATINGEPTQVLYAGIAPGSMQGANQVNVAVPIDLVGGPITIVLTVGAASQVILLHTSMKKGTSYSVCCCRVIDADGEPKPGPRGR